jgi:hypothetical protein
MGIYMWRVKGGFYKRQIQPAIIECVDGSKISIWVRPYHNYKEMIKAVKRLEHYYNHGMPKASLLGDVKPLVRKKNLPVRFVLPDDTNSGNPPKADFKVTPWEALQLGRQLMDFAKREKAKEPCRDCNSKGVVFDMGKNGKAEKIKCKKCSGTGFLKATKNKK